MVEDESKVLSFRFTAEEFKKAERIASLASRHGKIRNDRSNVKQQCKAHFVFFAEEPSCFFSSSTFTTVQQIFSYTATGSLSNRFIETLSCKSRM
jgi:hypothetical protein